MESIVRPVILLCLLAFVALQLYILLMKRDDVTWAELLKARLLVIYQPDKYLKRGAPRTIKRFVLAFALFVILIWIARWYGNQ